MQVFDRNKSVIAHLNTVPKKKHWDFLLFGDFEHSKIMELYRHPKELKTMNPIKGVCIFPTLSITIWYQRFESTNCAQ